MVNHNRRFIQNNQGITNNKLLLLFFSIDLISTLDKISMKIFLKSLLPGIIAFAFFLPLVAQEAVLPSTDEDVMKDWHQKGQNSELANGIGSDDWYASPNTTKSKKVIVAIIDSGVDIDHPDLKDNIWINPGEIAGNKIDDEGNGYIDDISGWNFLGGPNGTSVVKESLEVTRLYAKEKGKWENVDPEKLKGKKKKEYEEFLKMKEIVETKRTNATEHIAQAEAIQSIVMNALEAAKTELNGDSVDVERLEKSEKEEVQTAAKIIRNVEEQGVKVESIDWLIEIAKEQFAEQAKSDSDDLNYTYNPDYNARLIVGDVYTDFENRSYGNNNVDGEFSYHGTHVSGIIGALQNNGVGVDGIDDNVALMIVKTVPDGDERDKDVANAIIYAVDNGAEVINMSF